MNKACPTVYLVDDDASIRNILSQLIQVSGYSVKAFASANEFLSAPPPKRPTCLVLDVCMPDLDGLKLQEILHSSEDRDIPIIFITGQGDIPISVKAMKAGAVDFLSKPVLLLELKSSLRAAIEKDTRNLLQNIKDSRIKKLLGSLTPREYDTFILVVTGMPNKQVANRLNIAEKTVKVHRSRVMAKMKVQTFADLVRLAQDAGI
ncbi:MAG: response regulator [Fibrobacterota bacterium]